ncbi:MAG TPA: hypothetical protein VLQ93_05585, partial [Myxococcaceae bacterium]|nr:hypothetical protein [Myxococcaceae bacterium]
MRWRALLAVLLGLMLALPLAWLSSRWLPDALELPEAGTKHRLVPRLSTEAQRRLTTFLRSCRGQEDCEAPLVCLWGVARMRPYCTASECMTDVDCAGGFSCRALTVVNAVVRLCGASGRASEGARCRKLPRSQEEGCAPGLVCASGWCGRPCHPQEPRS